MHELSNLPIQQKSINTIKVLTAASFRAVLTSIDKDKQLISRALWSAENARFDDNSLTKLTCGIEITQFCVFTNAEYADFCRCWVKDLKKYLIKKKGVDVVYICAECWNVKKQHKLTVTRGAMAFKKRGKEAYNMTKDIMTFQVVIGYKGFMGTKTIMKAKERAIAFYSLQNDCDHRSSYFMSEELLATDDIEEFAADIIDMAEKNKSEELKNKEASDTEIEEPIN